MLRRLGARLALSHTLPILIVVPLLSVVLLYQLERNYLLDNLAEELARQGELIAYFTRGNGSLWQDAEQARSLVQHLQRQDTATLMLLDSRAHLLAATWADQQDQSGQLIDVQLVRRATGGQTVWTVDRNANGQELAVDVVVPVLNEQSGLEGFIRLSHRLTDLQQRLTQQRWLVLITLLGGAGISLVLGLVLARSLAAPLLGLTAAVARFSPEQPPEVLSESGPDELRLLAATLNRHRQHLYELEQTRKILLSGIVHELGRPLGSIKTAAQTIAQTMQNRSELVLISELAGGIDDQVEQLRLHLDDLALLGQLEVQGLTLRCEAVDLTTLLDAQHRQFARLVEQQDLTLTVQLDPGLPVIQADPKRLSQILGNLIHNACKYTPPGGHIHVSATSESSPTGVQSILLGVADSGPGIAPAEQERIFRLFYRSPSQSSLRQGMGIGLALARQLAEAHGGSLGVESRPGTGATFLLRLPVYEKVSHYPKTVR